MQTLLWISRSQDLLKNGFDRGSNVISVMQQIHEVIKAIGAEIVPAIPSDKVLHAAGGTVLTPLDPESSSSNARVARTRAILL